MKRPMVAVAAWYAAGLLLAECWQPPLTVLFGAAFLTTGLGLALARLRPVALVAALVLAGWAHVTARQAVLSPHDLRRLVPAEGAAVELRGRLLETPALRIFERDEQESWRTLARVQVRALRLGAHWQPAYGRIVATLPGTLPADFFKGRSVEITGVLVPPRSALAAGLFDYRAYLARERIYFQLRTDGAAAWRPLGDGPTTPPFSDRFLNWAQRTLARGLPEEDEPLRLLWAMTLGWRTALTGEVSAPFMRSGTMHIFAISGLHIALIAGILVGVLRVVQLPRAACGAVVIPLIWFYTAATGWQSSAVRSTVMMTIIVGGWALRRPSDLLNSLCAAAFLILLWEPEQLFQASFQLSFFVVLSLALCLPPLTTWRDRLLAFDPLLPPALVPRWKRALAGPLRWIGGAAATSLAAWLGSLPLTAHYFHLFSPVTLLANVLVVPLSALALASALGSLLCGGWFPWGGELFNHSAWFWMRAMVEISHRAAELPGAWFYVPAPSTGACVVWYAALAGVASGAVFQTRWRAVMLGCGVAVGALAAIHLREAMRSTTLAVLPLNGAHAVFVDAPGRARDLLVDCGNSNAVEFITRPFLAARGVNRIKHLILTHGDLRCFGGLELLDAELPVQNVLVSEQRFRSARYRELVGRLESSGRIRQLNRGETLGSWRVLHPQAGDRFSAADDGALVLLGAVHGTRVLLLSDLGAAGQAKLLEREPELRADIVIAGLPERSEALSDSLLAAVQPRVVIVADSEYPATHRAGAGLRERLGRRNVPVLYTRETGAVTLTFGPGRWRLRTHSGVELRSCDLSKENPPKPLL
ncbi:MAG: ComEC/Rec2 family competence protein [Verrucomicrobiae bacterium]|nr:ComEC/Rec2 family competence protein [Verrucomicrobiae bacterium]